MLFLLAGWTLSFLGSIPPGLISMSVAHITVQRGFRAAMTAAAGAALAEFFQAWAAVALSDYFLQNPALERFFYWASLPVFVFLGFYLLFWSKSVKKPAEYLHKNSFLKLFGLGLAVSAFNLLAIPYWFVYCAWLRRSEWWQEGPVWTFVFSAGVTLGTLCALGLYACAARFALQKSTVVARYTNIAVGLTFLGLAGKTLWGLLF
jgi:threonine/homoserine/homoserine lactone efflux protein